MTIHYHGTPITPMSAFMECSGRHYCVSHANPQDIKRAHEYGQSVMLDNGAFTKWKSGKATDWKAYYEWCDLWLDYPTTWAVIPDDIEGDASIQDELITHWPHGDRGAPVWHMHEPVERMLMLLDNWPKICFGSSSQYAIVGSVDWRRRIDHAFDEINKRHYDLYLLCKPDIPWVKDALREYPDEKPRQELFQMYKDILINQQTPWIEISGGFEARNQKAVAAIDAVLAR